MAGLSPLTKLVEVLNDAARGMMVYRRVTPEGSWTVTRPKKSLQILQFFKNSPDTNLHFTLFIPDPFGVTCLL
jgi:hypothetical protein